jgi:putative ABC transport system permease protein
MTMSTPPFLLEAHHVAKVYQTRDLKTVALADASIAACAGEFCSLLGASGSGKSTLLNLLGGLERPTQGEILFAGRSIISYTQNELASYRGREVGMIFQNFNLISHLTAQENVELAIALGGESRRKSARRKHAQELLEGVGLSHRLRHRPVELSGGEQQRVAIARALANRPRCLLADEPTGNLDSARAIEIIELLRSLVEREKLLVIMVTHDVGLARAASDRIVMLVDGYSQAESDETLSASQSLSVLPSRTQS